MDDATDHSSIRVMTGAHGDGSPGYTEIWSSQARGWDDVTSLPTARTTGDKASVAAAGNVMECRRYICWVPRFCTYGSGICHHLAYRSNKQGRLVGWLVGRLGRAMHCMFGITTIIEMNLRRALTCEPGICRLCFLAVAIGRRDAG